MDEATGRRRPRPRPRPRLFVQRERETGGSVRATAPRRSCAFTNGKIKGHLGRPASAHISPSWAGQVPTRRQGPGARPEREGRARGEQGVGPVIFSRQVLILARWERKATRVDPIRTRAGIASIASERVKLRPMEQPCQYARIARIDRIVASHYAYANQIHIHNA